MEDSEESGDLKDQFQSFILQNKFNVAFLLVGVILIVFGAIFYRTGSSNTSEVEIIDTEEKTEDAKIFVEVAGAVEKPGVYEMDVGKRIEDLLVASGGVTDDVDEEWLDKNINRAAKLSDGQKLYIPKVNEQSEVLSANNSSEGSTTFGIVGDTRTNGVNVNTASQSVLESLPGIGPVYAQKMIEQRPYSTLDDLIKKDVLPKHVFEKIKNLVTIY
jgi:competence protein ComEA